MIKFLILFYILISGTLFAQVQKKSVMIEDTTVYLITDSKPSFPGGISKMNKFIYTNLNYKKIFENDVFGKIFVQFIVEKDGKLSNIKITRSLDPYCDSEAVRMIRLMPKWKSGKISDKKVRTKIEIPITIKMK